MLSLISLKKKKRGNDNFTHGSLETCIYSFENPFFESYFDSGQG